MPNHNVVHYLITKQQATGWRIKGSSKCFPSLASLIIHHSVMRELLPCPLRMPLTSASSPDLTMAKMQCCEEGETEEEEDFVDLSRLADALSEDLLFTLRKAFGSSPELLVEACRKSEGSEGSASTATDASV